MEIESKHGSEPTSSKFYRWAVKRANASEGAFILSNLNDPDVQSFTNEETAFYEGKLAGLEGEDLADQHENNKQIIKRLAEKVVPGGGFDELVERLQTAPGLMEEVKQIMREADRGGVVALSNHSHLMDIAITTAAIYMALDDPELGKNLGLVINKMLGYLDVVIIEGDTPEDTISAPAIQTIQQFSEVYCVVPDGKSRVEYELEDFAAQFNPVVVHPLMRSLMEGGLVVIAGSGGVDEIKEADGVMTAEMRQVEKNTARLIKIGAKKIIDITTYLDRENKKIHFNVGDNLLEANSAADIHNMMRAKESTYASLIEKSGRATEASAHYDYPAAA